MADNVSIYDTPGEAGFIVRGSKHSAEHLSAAEDQKLYFTVEGDSVDVEPAATAVKEFNEIEATYNTPILPGTITHITSHIISSPLLITSYTPLLFSDNLCSGHLFSSLI